jgi:hypothetical protein
MAVAAVLFATPAAAQLQGPGLTIPPLANERSLDLSPSIGLRGWVGGRHGLLASDGLVASSMVLADWYPLAGGFRFSGGLTYGTAHLDAPAALGWRSPAVHADGSPAAYGADGRSWLTRGSPYVGLGWGLGATRGAGLYLSADLGLMYQRSSLATWGCPGGLPTATCAAEVRADGLGAADEGRLAPVMSFGVGLRF